VAEYKKELDAAKEEAKKDYKDDDNPSKATSFAQWAAVNAPGYLVAQKNW
jgi:hypothetical protein